MNKSETKDAAKLLAENYDHTSSELMNDPFEMFQTFHSYCPVGHTRQHGGFYFATTYETVKRGYEDYSTFTSSKGIFIPPDSNLTPPLDIDPPRQSEYRKVLNKHFTEDAVGKKQEEIENAINYLIDKFAPDGSVDLASALVRPLLPNIVLSLIGVPTEDCAQLSCLVQQATTKQLKADRKSNPETEITKYLLTLVHKRRIEKEHSGSLIGTLLDASIQGKPLNDLDICRTLLIILFAGIESTVAVMLESLLFFARHPEEKLRAMSDAFNWERATDEFVRYGSPVHALRRTVTRATELGGVSLKDGDRVMLVNSAANRDERKFSDADKCLLDRSPNPHLAFGAGAHHCLGRNLAKLEIKLVLKTVLARIPDYQLVDSSFQPDYFLSEVRSMKSLPVIFSPRGKPS